MIFQERFGESALGTEAGIQMSGPQTSRVTIDPAAVTFSPAKELFRLLSCDPLDLGHISDEIRAHPDFEVLVMRMAASLAVSVEGSVSSVEEAAVALDKIRLRVLVHMWASLRDDKARMLDVSNAHLLNDGANAPEALYIAAFVHLLGTDCSPKLWGRVFEQCPNPHLLADDSAELTTILVRDFISLIPFFGPMLEKDKALASSAG